MEPSQTENGLKIEYHADDFGLFPAQSQRILDCRRLGCLNGISIMPNSPWLVSCMELVGEDRELEITIHLNLIEGSSLTGGSLLSDGEGTLNCSFGKLLLASFLPGRAMLREQLHQELRAQIRAAQACLEPGRPLRLDSHAHYHMLPVVFDALMDVIREEKLDVAYIRLPEENVGLYLRHWRQLRDFSPINLVKVAILNLLVKRNRRKYGAYLKTLDQKLFLGVFLSGRMHRENVEPLLADAGKIAENRGWGLEILAHPGGVFEKLDIAKITNQDDLTFLTSEMRSREASLFEV